VARHVIRATCWCRQPRPALCPRIGPFALALDLASMAGPRRGTGHNLLACVLVGLSRAPDLVELFLQTMQRRRRPAGGPAPPQASSGGGGTGGGAGAAQAVLHCADAASP